MAKAIYKDTVLAESDDYEMVEGNIYFPPDTVRQEYFTQSSTEYECPWKGHADYFNIKVEGEIIKDGTWQYPNPTPAASEIKNHFAFDPRKGIEVSR